MKKIFGTAVGQWILRMYNDLYTIPTFFYFLPLYAFLFGYFAVNSSKVQKRTSDDTRQAFDATDVLRRLDNLENKNKSTIIKGLMY